MRLLDLFCGAGGCAVGYHRAGFTDIVGVDIKSQPRYPFTFVQGDALDYLEAHGKEFDLIHASPPCQAYSRARYTPGSQGKDYPDLIADTLQRLRDTGVHWVVENVEGAPLGWSVTLCGTMFGLRLRRHRLFCSSVFLMCPGTKCSHGANDLGVYAGKVTRLGTRAASYVASSGRTHYRPQLASLADGQEAMGIDWMNREELSQAIPPAYTEFIGKQIYRCINNSKHS